MGTQFVALALLAAASASSAFQPSTNTFYPHLVYQSKSPPLHNGPNNRHGGRPFSSVSLHGILDDIESQASEAADTWSIIATSFLEPDIASQVEERFKDRADVLALRVVGGRRSPSTSFDTITNGEGRRSRFVLVHPDLGFDIGTAEAEYCSVILVENVNVKASNTLPNALAGIGVHLDNVGDIVVVDESTVYLVVDPNVAKQCIRLLSKELVGVGISLSVVDGSEFMPHREMQEMKLSRVLERQMDRKKYEQGYVQFG